jgi:hypothetical protein
MENPIISTIITEILHQGDRLSELFPEDIDDLLSAAGNR